MQRPLSRRSPSRSAERGRRRYIALAATLRWPLGNSEYLQQCHVEEATQSVLRAEIGQSDLIVRTAAKAKCLRSADDYAGIAFTRIRVDNGVAR